ncbi:MAG: class I SAM-dependent methyltransferase [Candidatus Andersenbacteria bacterium]
MHTKIKEGWAASSRATTGTKKFWERSALVLLLLEVVDSKLRKHAKGDLLDAGAGTLSYRHLVRDAGCSYKSIDFKETHPELDKVGDIQDMSFEDNSFDTVLCVEVLEHVPYPAKALKEFYRVLRPGGKVIITVPHLGYLHNEPYDFYRYTKYGLEVLVTDAGFRIKTIEPSGGLIAFLQHIPATLLIGVTHDIPIIGLVVHELTYWCSKLTIAIDRVVDKRKLFAVHYVLVAEKD